MALILHLIFQIYSEPIQERKMKLTVTFELDKDSSQYIKTSFSSLTKQLSDLIDLFKNAEYSVEEAAAVEPDPKPATKPAKQVPKKKSKPRKSNIDTILKTIKKHKEGISSKELQQETGFTGKQVSNSVFRLKNENKIEKTEAGMFVVL
jgi:predicted Rossmann fold nucleotide-binding protein DprA/Smf involved in DNA uptake